MIAYNVQNVIAFYKIIKSDSAWPVTTLEPNMIKHTLTALAVCAVLAGCSTENAQQLKQQTTSDTAQNTQLNRAEIDGTINTYTRTFITHQPALATSLKLQSSEYGEYANRLPNYSLAGMQALQIDMHEAAE